jgi:hypothetical protein
MRRVGETERHHGIAGPAEAWSRCGSSVFLVRIMRVLSLCTFSVLHWFDNGDRARMQTEKPQDSICEQDPSIPNGGRVVSQH